MKKLFSILIALALSALFVWVLMEQTSTQEEDEHDHDHHHEEEEIALSTEQIKTYGIQTQRSRPGVLALTLSARGKVIIHPDQLIHILPNVSGVAKEALKNIGDKVGPGELLAVLESREMADVKADYLAANEKWRLAFASLEREKRLNEKKISAEQDYLNAKSAYQEASINVQLARQKLHAFGLNEYEIDQLLTQNEPDLRLYEIRSPMDGVILDRHITKGEFIENNSTIYEIADLNKVWVEIGIYPKDLYKVKEGQKVQVRLPYNNVEADAKIIYVSPIVQDETITSKVIAELNNSKGEWRPGTFVQVDIDMANQEAAITIPKGALQEIEGRNYVFVRSPEGFKKRAVEIGENDRSQYEILSGLFLGEEYAVTKTFLLKADLGKNDLEHEH